MPGLREQLLAARPDDALVRWAVTDASTGDLSVDGAVLVDGRNVAWRGRASRPGERWATGLGDDPRAVAALVEAIAARHEIDGVTVPEAAFAALPPRLRSPDPGHWCYWTRPVGIDGLESGSAKRLLHDDSRIGPLLAHSASAHVFPGDERIIAWYGVERGPELVAVAARLQEASGAAHLVSVCTHPDARGEGLGRMVCAAGIAEATAEGAPMIVLEMYVANDAGRALYSGLGFTERGRYLSGLLDPRAD